MLNGSQNCTFFFSNKLRNTYFLPRNNGEVEVCTGLTFPYVNCCNDTALDKLPKTKKEHGNISSNSKSKKGSVSSKNWNLQMTWAKMTVHLLCIVKAELCIYKLLVWIKTWWQGKEVIMLLMVWSERRATQNWVWEHALVH